MTQKTIGAIIVCSFLILIITWSSLFTVDERQRALILQFGELRAVHNTPGLKLKVPFIQNVIYYDKRLLDYNLPPIEVMAGDQKRIIIDLFTRYIIEDPLRFYKTVGTEAAVKNRLAAIVGGSMRQVIGNVPLTGLLSKEREKIMAQIREEVRDIAKDFGIIVKDVRIVSANLPKENSNAIYERMRTERMQEAELFRAEGKKAAQEVRSAADRTRAVILAEASKRAQLIRGTGDAKAIKIYSNAFGQEPSLFEFLWTLQAYSEALKAENTTFILSPDNAFLKYLEKGPSSPPAGKGQQ